MYMWTSNAGNQMIKYFLEAPDVVPLACEWDDSVSI